MTPDSFSGVDDAGQHGVDDVDHRHPAESDEAFKTADFATSSLPPQPLSPPRTRGVFDIPGGAPRDLARAPPRLPIDANAVAWRSSAVLAHEPNCAGAAAAILGARSTTPCKLCPLGTTRGGRWGFPRVLPSKSLDFSWLPSERRDA